MMSDVKKTRENMKTRRKKTELKMHEDSGGEVDGEEGDEEEESKMKTVSKKTEMKTLEDT
jgi:hypothetical protein